MNLKKLQKGASLTPLSSGLITPDCVKETASLANSQFPSFLSFVALNTWEVREYIKEHPIVTTCLIHFLCNCRRQTFWEEQLLTPEFRLAPQCSAAYVPGTWRTPLHYDVTYTVLSCFQEKVTMVDSTILPRSFHNHCFELLHLNFTLILLWVSALSLDLTLTFFWSESVWGVGKSWMPQQQLINCEVYPAQSCSSRNQKDTRIDCDT